MIQFANDALNKCKYDGISYKCEVDDFEAIAKYLGFAIQFMGNLTRENIDENMEYAYNNAVWAKEYAYRCINPSKYYGDVTLLDLHSTDDHHQ